MTTEHLEQNTAAWMQSRVGKLTASRWPAVQGISPFTSREQLLREMVREALGQQREFTGNKATQWGHDHEAEAAEAFELETGDLLETCGSFIHPDYPDYGASPDRLLNDDAVVEIKCPFSKKIPEEPDPHYIAQVRWQLFVTGRTEGWLYYWAPNKTALFHVEPYSQEEMPNVLAAAKTFMSAYRDALADPEVYLRPDKVERDDSEWAQAVMLWKSTKAKLANAQDSERMAREHLIDMADQTNSIGAGASVSFGQRAGSVNWQAIAKAHGIDKAEQERYRKPATELITVRELKD